MSVFCSRYFINFACLSDLFEPLCWLTGRFGRTDAPFMPPNRLLKYSVRKRKAMLGDFDFSDFPFAS